MCEGTTYFYYLQTYFKKNILLTIAKESKTVFCVFSVSGLLLSLAVSRFRLAG